MTMPAIIASTPAVTLPLAHNDNASPDKFRVGCTYHVRSICDHNAISRYKIVARTEKTVTIERGNGKRDRRKVSVYDGIEQIYPDGQYSMCNVLRASHQTRLD